MLVAQLEIDLVAGIAQISKDIGAFKRDFVGHMKDVNDAVETTKKALEALGIGLSVGFVVEFVKSSIEATAHMKELGVQAGTTAAAISRFELPARAAGSSLDAVALAMSHMSKAIVDGQDPANRSAAALKAIGLSSQQLINMKPDEAFIAVSKALAEYSDGAQKNAVIQQVLGRATGDVKAVLAEVAEGGKLAATVTNEQAAEANKLTTEMVKLKMQSEQLTRGVLAEWVPSFTRIVEAAKQAREESGLLAAAWVALGGAASELLGHASPAKELQTDLAKANDELDTAKKNWEDVLHASSAVAQVSAPAAFARLIEAQQNAIKLQELLNAYAKSDLYPAGMYDDQASRAARAGHVLPGGKPAPAFGGADATAAAIKAANDLNDVLAKIDARADGFTKDWVKDMTILAAGFQTGQLSATQYAAAVGKLIAQQPVVLKAWDTQEESLKRYVDLLKEAAQAQTDAVNAADDLINGLQDQGTALEAEIKTMGMSEAERGKYLLDLKTEIELRKVLSDPNLSDEAAARKQTEILAERDKVKVLIDEKQVISDQLSLWGQVGDAAGNFFSDLILHGKTAFDNLRQYVKQLLADMIALFAKRWILQLAASATGSTALGAAASSAGQGTVGSAAGSVIGAGANYVGGALLAGGGAGGFTGAFSAGYTANAAYLAGAAETAPVYGTVAGEMGGAAAGIGEGITTVLSAIPVWGWIALAVIAIAAYFGGKGGGPKIGGSSFGSFDASGGFLGSAAVPGSDNGRFFTPDQLDPQMAQYSQAVATSYNTAVNRYGGHALGLDIGAGTDSDPQGSAQSRISGMVVDRATGEVLYHNQDQSMDDKAVPQALSLQAQQMVIAALQHSDLPQYLANVFKGVDAVTLTQDQVNNLFQMADALKGIMDVASRDPLADAAQSFADSMDPFNTALRNNGTAIRSVMGAYDGTTTSAQNLQQATLAYYNAQVQLLNQITSAKQAIDSMFGDTFRSFKLAGMSDQQKYDFYQKEAKDLTAQAMSSTDPAEIQRLVQQITQDEQSAFALLTPEQQAGVEGQAFITQGTTAQHLIEGHLDDIKDAVADATKDTLGEIKDLISGPTGSMNSAAATMNGAANTIADSADKPLHVIVDNPSGQEVTG